MIFDKGVKTIQWGKIVSSASVAEKTVYPHGSLPNSIFKT